MSVCACIHIHHVCIFMAETSSQYNTACLEVSTIDQENRSVCFSVVRKPNRHVVISPLCVYHWKIFPKPGQGTKKWRNVLLPKSHWAQEEIMLEF